jgi:hypothetical protein
MDFPELGPAILYLAEIAACDLQLVHVLRIGIFDRVWTLYFDLVFERQGAGSERPAECLHLCGQLAVLELGSVLVMEDSQSLCPLEYAFIGERSFVAIRWRMEYRVMYVSRT